MPPKAPEARLLTAGSRSLAFVQLLQFLEFGPVLFESGKSRADALSDERLGVGVDLPT